MNKKFDYIFTITVLENEKKEFYVDGDITKELDSAIKLLKKNACKIKPLNIKGSGCSELGLI